MKLIFSRHSLQSRLLAMVVGFVVVVWVCAAVLTWFDAREGLDELLDGHLAQAAALLSVQADGDDDEVAEAPITHKYAPQVAFQVYVNGLLITRSPNVGKTPMSRVADGFSSVRMADGTLWRVFSMPVPSRFAQVYVAEKLEGREDILWSIMRSMLWPLVVALPLLLISGYLAVRGGLTPLRSFSETLRHRSPQALEPVHSGSLPPELQPLAEALNSLLQRIALMMESERRFTADAAHELRTPIASIRAQAQVALDADENQTERRKALQATLTGCDRATRLVEQLLTMARLEVCVAATSQPVDLADLVRRVSADLAPASVMRSQELELSADHPCFLALDETLLSVLVRNLVDNAMRYSPDGATILVEVHNDPDGVMLRVQDSGLGMDPQALQRLGERFFRVLGSSQPGSGLGWSIVHRLASIFGAQVHASRSELLGGLRVEVRWAV
jgi:two-component system sensor histidine kinase QseC